MNKTAQNLTWNCLPLEVRNEVERQYQIATNAKEYYTECTLEYLFGIHNLTSDAEGEEMLTCVKDQAVKLYDIANKAYAISGDKWYQGYMKAMIDLFGSKCLPDEEPKPAEPKFKRGDRVRIIKQNHPQYGKTATVDTLVIGAYPEVLVNLGGNLTSFDEFDLEPYTEPEEKDHIVQDNEMVDNIIKDGFREHNKLHIAAMAMQGILSNSNPKMVDMPIDRVVQLADAMASLLIAECGKGGSDGGD